MHNHHAAAAREAIDHLQIALRPAPSPRRHRLAAISR